MANGDILDRLEVDINSALENKRLAQDKRLMYKTMQTFVIYLKDDHKKLADIEPKVKTLWDCKEASDIEKKENKKMVLSPLYNILITLGVTTIFNSLFFYFAFYKVLSP